MVRAYTNSEWDICDFAIITIQGGWKEQMEKRIETVRPLRDEIRLGSAHFWNDIASFYVSENEDVDEIISDGKKWAFVELEKEEESKFAVPETYLDYPDFVLYTDGSGHYKASAKYTNDEFYTEDLPFREIIESMNTNT